MLREVCQVPAKRILKLEEEQGKVSLCEANDQGQAEACHY